MNRYIPLLLAALLASPLAMAEEKSDSGPACQLPGKHMNQADTNHDGSIDKAEAQAMHDRHFDEMDQNKDGKLSKDEIAACKDKDHQHH